MADAAIEAASREVLSDRRLRPDARLFLLVNLHQLVVLPLAIAGLPPSNDDSFERRLIEDTMIILKSASEHGEDGEISAAGIVRALSSVLDRLHLKEWRIWSKSNDAVGER